MIFKRRVEAETAPGIIEERRAFLWAPLGVAAAVLLDRLSAEGNTESMNRRELSFEDFVRESGRVAKQIAADTEPWSDEHLLRLSEVAARLRLSAVPEGKLGAFANLNPPVEFGPVHFAMPLFIIKWRMAPGALLPAHNHTPGNVVTLCLEGECRVRHFEVEGREPDYSSKETFLIRETQNLLLTPGRMSSLTEKRDQIHTFQAGSRGATGIDINVALAGDKKFSFLEFSDRPKDAERRIFEATWKKV
ncbi:MAG TPA: hypothetical protein VJQ56_08540 [Blastocatellia bacterium]|nr:hypothetical protein [Blastocatellia bacterium]